MSSGSQITMSNGELQVPDDPIIYFIEGDGIGIDITPVMQKVVDAAVQKAYGGVRLIHWNEVLAGQKAYDNVGEWLPDETKDAMRTGLVSIKGPLTTPVGGGIRSLNVALRQQLDLFACVRPVRWYDGTPSPVRDPASVDMIIFRENSEDVYAGIEWESGSQEVSKVIDFLQNEMGVSKIRFPETAGIGIKPVSVEGTARIVRAAINHAINQDLSSVTLVHKGNIMKFTEGGFSDLLPSSFSCFSIKGPFHPLELVSAQYLKAYSFLNGMRVLVVWVSTNEDKGSIKGSGSSDELFL